MRRIVLTIIVFQFIVSWGLSAQTVTGGTIKYQKQVPLREKLGNEWNGYKDQVPVTASYNFILYFSGNKSLFIENAKENEAPNELVEKAMWMVNEWYRPFVKPLKLYINMEEELLVRQTEFMTRWFREELSIEKRKWKMGENNKTIKGYSCMQAETEIDGNRVIAWFTPDIPVPYGPEYCYGLPGLILEASINNGQQSWIATEISLNQPPENLLAEPKEGRKVKPEQYIKIQEEKLAEWEKQKKTERLQKADYIKK